MRERFQQFISDNKLCSKGDKVLLAFSGGLDSIVLLTLFLENNYDFSLAHCNFKLRGDESDQDENFVRAVASELNIKLFVKKCDARHYAKAKKLSIQEAARDLRYSFFQEIASRESFNKIAIAHHADDQIETFFINLFRGSGLQGLKGMPLQRGKIIRPLLFAGRAEIEAFASKHNLRFREDSSNASDKYLRNKIRHHLLPLIGEILPKAKNTIAKSLTYLQEDALLMQQLMNEKKESLLIREGEHTIVSLHQLMKLRPLDVWLFYLLKDLHFQRKTTNDLAFVLQQNQRSACGKTFRSESHKLLVDRDKLVLQRIEPEVQKTKFLITETVTELKEPIHLRFSLEQNTRHFMFEKSPSIAYFDAQKIQYPLTLRKWKQGDRFVPFGMQGSKLVSDYFIDKKVDRFTKNNTWLLLSGEEIIWVIGYRSSENFRVGKAVDRVLKICLETG